MKAIFSGVLGIVMTLASAGPAPATFKSGNDFLADCTAPETVRSTNCLGYLTAVADALEHSEINGYKACIPGSVEAGQLEDIVIQFLRADAVHRHYAAVGLIAHAFERAFPCH